MRAMTKAWTGGWVLLAVMLAGCAGGPSGPGTTPNVESMGASQTQETPKQGAVVTLMGDVAHRVIPWENGLTLMDAFSRSGYRGDSNPAQLVIHRKGQLAISVDFEKLNTTQD